MMERIKFPIFSGDIRDNKRFKEVLHHCTTRLSEIKCFFQLTRLIVNPRERNKGKSCASVRRAREVLDLLLESRQDCTQTNPRPLQSEDLRNKGQD